MQVKWGITGGIGAGKSFVANLIRQLSIPVFDCDIRAKQLIVEDEKLRSSLILTFGNEVYDEAGNLNRQYLAKQIFTNSDNLLKINAIVHPAVQKDFLQWANEQVSEMVAMESAILYESGFDKIVDKVLYIEAPTALRLERTMKRDNATREEILQRIAKQQCEHYIDQVDAVIINDGTKTKQQILEQLKQLFAI